MGAAVLKVNRPSLPVTPFGVNLTDPMSNFGWSVTFTPSTGLPLNSTVPDVGTVPGAEMPPRHPAIAAHTRAASTTRLVVTDHLPAVATAERPVGGHADVLADELHAPVAEQEVAPAGVRTAERIDRACVEDVAQGGRVGDGPAVVRTGQRVHRHGGAALAVVVAAAGRPGDRAARLDR